MSSDLRMTNSEFLKFKYAYESPSARNKSRIHCYWRSVIKIDQHSRKPSETSIRSSCTIKWKQRRDILHTRCTHAGCWSAHIQRFYVEVFCISLIAVWMWEFYRQCLVTFWLHTFSFIQLNTIWILLNATSNISHPFNAGTVHSQEFWIYCMFKF